MKTLEEIEGEVTRLARFIGATGNDLPTYGHTRDGAYPHIEVDDINYHYVAVERGQEIRRDSSPDFEELLYWIFSDITHSLAFSYELHHRIEDQDCRRIAFPKQIELLNCIHPKMAQRRALEIAGILRNAPYDDEPMKVVNRMSIKS